MKAILVGGLIAASAALRVPLAPKSAELPRLGARAASALVLAPLPALAEPGDIWDRLANEPPVSFNPFTINPAGYAFLGLYAIYWAWQIFGPVSEAEREWGEKMKAEADVAAAAVPGFLADAAAAEGAIVTPSGLVYQELEAGSGASPTTDQVVKVDYHGTLHDGTVFDSSRDRGEPAEFKRTLRRLGSAAEGTSAPAPRVRTYTPQRLCT